MIINNLFEVSVYFRINQTFKIKGWTNSSNVQWIINFIEKNQNLNENSFDKWLESFNCNLHYTNELQRKLLCI